MKAKATCVSRFLLLYMTSLTIFDSFVRQENTEARAKQMPRIGRRPLPKQELEAFTELTTEERKVS